MANLPNMIVADVAGMRKGELQLTPQNQEESRKDNDTPKQKNEAFTLLIEQLTTQLDKNYKFLVINDKEAQLLRRVLQACETKKCM